MQSTQSTVDDGEIFRSRHLKFKTSRNYTRISIFYFFSSLNAQLALCKVNLYSSRDHTKSMCASNERRNENEERKRTAWCWLVDGGWSMEKEVESSMNVFKSCLRRSRYVCIV